MICWHKWSKWETYIQEGSRQRHPFSKEMLPFSEKRQRKFCHKCNKEKDRRVDE